MGCIPSYFCGLVYYAQETSVLIPAQASLVIWIVRKWEAIVTLEHD